MSLSQTNLLATTEIMSPEEVQRIASKTILQEHLLQLALWERTTREGREQFITSLDLMDVVVWRKKDGNLVWASVQARWLPEGMIDALESYLRVHGFVGKRINDEAHHITLFLSHRARMHVHLFRHSYGMGDFTDVVDLARFFPGHLQL
jgi:hypothetical protein